MVPTPLSSPAGGASLRGASVRLDSAEFAAAFGYANPPVPLPDCSVSGIIFDSLGHATVDSSASSSAARIWEFRSPDKKTIYTIDFVVVDQQKSTMEGLIPTNRIGQFKDQLKEGCVYTIDKFDLYDPKKSYRSVDNPLRITFTMRTILTEVIPSLENFPMFAYTALPFSMLSDRVDEVIVLSDIVGLVNKVTPLLPPSGRAKSHKQQVYITDGRFVVLYEHISDEVVPPDSPARGKHRATSADKNPKEKKELRFSKDD
ncbi:hypothetical protein ACQ4PT_023157 [Festuca glaucescens]